MHTKMIVVLAAIGLAVGVGCQQQQGKPKAAVSTKGLSNVYFDFDRSDIKSDSKETLEGNASWLKKHMGEDISIQGHCDERGTEEYNIALGHRRAKSAKDYLVSLGIEGKRLSTKSFGEEKPLETCHNESCWWKNRRAEFVK